MTYHIGIDLGGTYIAAGVVDENYAIVGRGVRPTQVPCTAKSLCDDLAEVCRMAAGRAGLSMDDIAQVGVAAPGMCDTDTGELVFATNLHLYHVPLREMLSQQLGKPVYLENDANAAALGELLAGAAQGARSVLAVTLGTGVGGGIILNGAIYRGAYFAGGELGHLGMIFNGRPCNCGRRGCIETYCSATGLINTTKEFMLADPTSKMWEMVDGSLDGVSGRTPFDAMRLGDKAASKAVELYTKHLAYALTGYINLLQPQVLVVGGGLIGEGETLLAPVREIVEREAYDRFSTQHTRIVAAHLGNDAGIVGAAFLSSCID